MRSAIVSDYTGNLTMPQPTKLPPEVIGSIREHIRRAVDDTRYSFERAEEDDDTMTGHLGAKLKHGPVRVDVGQKGARRIFAAEKVSLRLRRADRASQKSSNRPLSLQQRSEMMALAPGTDQCSPEPFEASSDDDFAESIAPKRAIDGSWRVGAGLRAAGDEHSRHGLGDSNVRHRRQTGRVRMACFRKPGEAVASQGAP